MGADERGGERQTVPVYDRGRDKLAAVHAEWLGGSVFHGSDRAQAAEDRHRVADSNASLGAAQARRAVGGGERLRAGCEEGSGVLMYSLVAGHKGVGRRQARQAVAAAKGDGAAVAGGDIAEGVLCRDREVSGDAKKRRGREAGNRQRAG